MRVRNNLKIGSVTTPPPRRPEVHGHSAKTFLLPIFVFVLLLAARQDLPAYVLEGPIWPSNTIVNFQLALGSANRTLLDGNTSWDVAASPAFGMWNPSLLRVQIVGNTGSGGASSNDGVNSIVFTATVYGQSFGSGTLAVTYYTYTGSTMKETDVLFNANQNFDSYRGALRFGSNGYAIGDIRRVLVHELGHALGLKHPDQSGQNVDAIMNSVISNREVPSADDVNGGQYLYGARAPAALAITSTSRLTNGHMVLQCAGAPNAVNRVEVSPDLASFTTLSSVTVDSTGGFQFEDVNSGGYTQRFYRVAYP